MRSPPEWKLGHGVSVLSWMFTASRMVARALFGCLFVYFLVDLTGQKEHVHLVYTGDIRHD